MHWCFACICVCAGVGCPGAGVTESYELSCGSWELNLGPLEDQLCDQLLFCLFLNQVMMAHTYNLSTLEV